MLGEYDVRVDIGVKDLDVAKSFYENTLGLKKLNENQWEVHYQSGSSQLRIYVSEYAGSNQATYASWEVDDINKVVDDLKSKGADFQHYDMPGTTLEGDVHTIMGKQRAAWFKDPDGNILCVTNEA